MKLGFSLLVNGDSLWAKLVMGKYKCSNFSSAAIKQGQHVSKIWRAIVKVKDEVLWGVKWSVVSGDKVRFWADAWAGDLGPLCNLAFCPLSEHEMNLKVCDMLNENGTWNWNLFKDKVSVSSLFHISACCVSRLEHEKDVCFWNGTSTGRFSVK